jgi:segregation and condensation protein B
MSQLPNQSSGSAAWGRRQHTVLCDSRTGTEFQKHAFRRGPSTGKLIRSDRLARLEAVLLISRTALSARRLAQLAGLVDAAESEQLIKLLNQSYDQTGSAFRIECTATGFLMMTRPALVTWLDRIHLRQAEMRLSQPMMETLTIIAYQQPITRASVEAVRGVQSAEMIRQLIDRGLVKVGGEEDSLGRPFLFITTRAFLDMFGLGRVQELPDYETLGRPQTADDIELVEVEVEEDSADGDSPVASGCPESVSGL